MNSADPQYKLLLSNVASAAGRLDWRTIWDCIDNRGFPVDDLFGVEQQTLAHHAAFLGQIGALEGLRQRGAKLEGIYNKSGFEPIHLAAKSGRRDVVEWLANRGVNLDSAGDGRKPVPVSHVHGAAVSFDEPCMPALHWAAKRGDVAMARLLLDFGADANSRDYAGNTPLMVLAKQANVSGTKQIAGLLQMHGADVSALNNKGESVMMAATYKPDFFGLADFMADMGVPLEVEGASSGLHEWIRKRPVSLPLAERFVRGRKAIVQLDPQTIEHKNALFAYNEQGYTPLDDPRNWQRLPALAEALAKRGEPLQKADFATPRVGSKNWLVRAVECGGYEPLQKVLREAGEPITGKDFVREDDPAQMSALGVAANDAWLAGRVFGKLSHWKGCSPQEVQRFMKELPQPMREQVGNLHQLLARLPDSEAQAAMGRR